MYETKSIPSNDVGTIEKFVLPKPPKPVPELDLENEQTRLDSIRYMIRTYGEKEGNRKWKERDFSVIDKKMIHTMGKLFERYNRSCLERQTISETEYIQPELSKEQTKVDVKCKAFKMNGEPCTAKAKVNGLCLRHSKKI
jgi:hypothetical protein